MDAAAAIGGREDAGGGGSGGTGREELREEEQEGEQQEEDKAMTQFQAKQNDKLLLIIFVSILKISVLIIPNIHGNSLGLESL